MVFSYNKCLVWRKMGAKIGLDGGSERARRGFSETSLPGEMASESSEVPFPWAR